MKITLRGWNAFYDGWLLRVLQKDDEAVAWKQTNALVDAAFLLGYKTADESYGTGIGDILLVEIEMGHILVERKL